MLRREARLPRAIIPAVDEGLHMQEVVIAAIGEHVGVARRSAVAALGVGVWRPHCARLAHARRLRRDRGLVRALLPGCAVAVAVEPLAVAAFRAVPRPGFVPRSAPAALAELARAVRGVSSSSRIRTPLLPLLLLLLRNLELM